jgi:hypothetical protein
MALAGNAADPSIGIKASLGPYRFLEIARVARQGG